MVTRGHHPAARNIFPAKKVLVTVTVTMSVLQDVCVDTTIVKSSTHTPSPHTIAASGNRSNINRKNVQTKNIYCRNCVQKATPQSPMSVRPSVCLSSKPLNSLKSSSFIIHLSSFIILHSSFIHPSSFFIFLHLSSSFFIHPSFISRLLSFSACYLTS